MGVRERGRWGQSLLALLMSLFLNVPLFCGSTESLRDLPSVKNVPLPCLQAAVTPQTTKHTSPIQNEFVLKTHERALKLPFIHERRFKLWNSGRTFTNLRSWSGVWINGRSILSVSVSDDEPFINIKHLTALSNAFSFTAALLRFSCYSLSFEAAS